MLLLWLAAILSRNTIRAHWWAYRIASTASPVERLGCFQRLASLGDKALPAVNGLLTSDDAELRSFAVGVLHHAPSGRAFDLLLTACRDVDPDVARLAVGGVVMRGAERAVKALTTLTGSDNERHAMIAAAALGDIGSGSARQALTALLRSSPHVGVRVEAITGLEALQAREAIDPLIDALDDTAVYEGITERDMRMRRAFDAAGADRAVELGLPLDASVHLENRHVVWRYAARALRNLSGHSFDFAADESADRSAVAQAWRAWRQEQAKDAGSLP